MHLCEVKEVIPYKKLAYSWTYEGFEGYSQVSFELIPEASVTKLRLVHEGLESFPQHIADFARKSFEAGWTHIVGTSLKDYLEK